MKTKIKLLTILIAIFAVTLIAGLVAGCSIGEITAEEQARRMGYTCTVTYYTNGGSFKEGQSSDLKSYKTVFYKPGKPILNIIEDANSQNLTISRTGYTFKGWEYCVLDENDNPVLKDYNGEPVAYRANGTADMKNTSTGMQLPEDEKKFIAETDGRKVFEDGKVALEKNQKIFIAAKWEKDAVVEFKMVTDSPMVDVTIKGEYGQDVKTTLNTGDTFHEQTFSGMSTTVRHNIFRPSITFKEGDVYSYIHLYKDAACTQPLGDREVYNKPAAGEPNPVIYVKYLEGEWGTIKTATDFSAIFNATEAGNYFVVFDIDCAEVAFQMRSADYTFNHTIVGYSEKCTISNINIENPITGLGQQITGPATGSAAYSLFGTLGADAQIKDIALKDVEVKVIVASGDVNLYLVMSDFTEGAKIENFTVDGVTLTVNISLDRNARVPNLGSEADKFSKRDSWLFGGFESDAAFTSEHSGVTVDNAQIIISNYANDDSGDSSGSDANDENE